MPTSLTGNTSLPLAGRDVAYVCIHNPDNISNYEPVPEEAHYCMM
jgi:hypothetical protein